NSCRLALPTITHPACLSRRITGASLAAGTLGRMIPPAVVTMPFTSTRSLTATLSPGPCSSEREMNAFSSTRPIVGFVPGPIGAAALSLPADVKPDSGCARGEPLVEQGRRADLVPAPQRRDPGPRRPPAGDDQRPRAP